MAQSRKDNRGRTLRKGEVQRSSDLRYLYTYTDPLGKRRFVYAKDLMSLREKEKELLDAAEKKKKLVEALMNSGKSVDEIMEFLNK